MFFHFKRAVPALLMVFCLMAGCANGSSSAPPRYVWYCHIAGGGNCTGEMIRCRDRQQPRWVDAHYCEAVVAKPASLVRNQSYPPVSDSALLPGGR